MAFEDRSSPNTATSPGAETGILQIPNSPESSRTSPYTCTTITQKNDTNSSPQHKNVSDSPKTEQEKSIFRITSFALPPSPKHDNLLLSPSSHNITYHQVYSPPKSLDDDTASVKSYGTASETSNQQQNEEEDEELPTIQTLKYSIWNILQPDFGKCALQTTRVNNNNNDNNKDNQIQTTQKIMFKPYENLESQKIQPPLGSLCQTVSQIGKNNTTTTTTATTLSSITYDDQQEQEQEQQQQENQNKSPTKQQQDTLPNPEEIKNEDGKVPTLWPAWVYCTRYSDRPSSGPRSRRMKKSGSKVEDKRPRTAFSGAQLARLKHEFTENRYLTERRRQQLSAELGLNEAQIKIWFQNKRAKLKKSNGQKNPLALQLMAQGLYNHSTVACDEDDLPLSN